MKFLLFFFDNFFLFINHLKRYLFIFNNLNLILFYLMDSLLEVFIHHYNRFIFYSVFFMLVILHVAKIMSILDSFLKLLQYSTQITFIRFYFHSTVKSKTPILLKKLMQVTKNLLKYPYILFRFADE